MPSDEFLSGAAALCRRYELLIADKSNRHGPTGRFSQSSMETSSRHGAAAKRCRASSGGALYPQYIFDKISIAWTVRRCMDRPSPRMILRWPRASPRSSAQGREADRSAAKRAELRLGTDGSLRADEKVPARDISASIRAGRIVRLKASWNVLETATRGLSALITVPRSRNTDPDQVSGPAATPSSCCRP